MSTLTSLLHFVGGHRLPEEDDGPARRLQLVAAACGASALLTALYGLAAGSTSLSLALANTYKVPMVVLLSTVLALPAALLTWKLVGATSRASDLVVGSAAGVLTASLVLAVLSPVVALYYHTSGWMGGALAMATCTLALGVGVAVSIRAVWSRAREGFLLTMLPLGVLLVVQLATLAQLVHVASPILPEETVFDGGVDAMLTAVDRD